MTKLLVAAMAALVCFAVYYSVSLESTRVEKARRVGVVAREAGDLELARTALAYCSTSMDYEIRRFAQEELFYLDLQSGHISRANQRFKDINESYMMNAATLLAMADFAFDNHNPGVAHRTLDFVESRFPELRGRYAERRARWKSWIKETGKGRLIYTRHECPYEPE